MRAKRESTKTPVASARYIWPALGLALLLHGALFALLLTKSPLTPEPSPLRDSLQVRLVQAPASSAQIQQSQIQQSPSVEPFVIESLVMPVTIPEARPEAELRPEVKPEPSSKSKNSLNSEVAAKPKSKPQSKPKPESKPASEPKASPSPPGDKAAAAPSGRDLLAGATASVRDQGFVMQTPDALPNTPSQRAARERYIADWTRRVEDIGNRMYPAPAHLAGQLRIRVVIDTNGQLVQTEVIQSSGHPELDQAALQAVETAGPYRPFDQGLQGLERLEFSRTWRFGKGNNFGVH